MVMMMMKIMMKMISPSVNFDMSYFHSGVHLVFCICGKEKRTAYPHRVRDENILPGFLGADLPRGMRHGNWGVLGSSTV